MKTSTTYMVRLIEAALKKDIMPKVEIRGSRGELGVRAIQNNQHTVLLTLDRQAGFIAVHPDDILNVWVPKLPPAFQPEAI